MCRWQAIAPAMSPRASAGSRTLVPTTAFAGTTVFQSILPLSLAPCATLR